MDQQVQWRTAVSSDAHLAATLMHMTSGKTADYLFGAGDPAQAKTILARLFMAKNNRYSHQFTDIAEHDGQPIGLLLSYPATQLTHLSAIMVKQLFTIIGWKETFQFLNRTRPLMTVTEAESDDYFVHSVAILPQLQGRGMGSQLMALAERKTEAAGLSKCALTVGLENQGAIALYKRLGYHIVDTVMVDKLQKRIGTGSYHRMVKEI